MRVVGGKLRKSSHGSQTRERSTVWRTAVRSNKMKTDMGPLA